MESFYINLNSHPERSKRFRRFIILISIILVIMVGLTFWAFYAFSIFNIWLILLLSLHTIIYFYLVYKGYKSELYVKSDSSVLSYKLSLYRRTPTLIFWGSIRKVKIGPTYVTFHKRSGKRKTMYLGWLSYANNINIKHNIDIIARQLNIEIEYGEIIEYVE
ncbi:MAG: hypothetical protein ACOX0M_08085 [Salinivirgaceae bacterium]|jgi:hypothetical protein|nr:hypothetical protein [Bacteroidales bacterium]